VRSSHDRAGASRQRNPLAPCMRVSHLSRGSSDAPARKVLPSGSSDVHANANTSRGSADELEVLRLAGAFGLGYATGEGAGRLGVLGLVDLMAPQHAVSLGGGTELDASVVTITLNLTVNLGLY